LSVGRLAIARQAFVSLQQPTRKIFQSGMESTVERILLLSALAAASAMRDLARIRREA
jgi:hypothetical protein